MAVHERVAVSPPQARYAVEHFVASELGNSSYLIADPTTGESVVIDPLRDVDQYVDCARSHQWQITHALDTHLHNDFLSGGHELHAAGFGRYLRPWTGEGTGDPIGPGDEIALGTLRLRAVHTPGHTSEHLSYLVVDGHDAPQVLFSGGALMVGTIARPDLQGAERTFENARSALHTVRDVLAPLPDSLLVLPTHGAGSFCGAGVSGERVTTLGVERHHNELLTASDFFAFFAAYGRQGEYPAYYREMAPRNRRGAPLLHVGHAPLERLSADAAGRASESGAWVLDVRDHAAFDDAHIPGSLNLATGGPMSAWLGWLMPIDDRVVLVAADENQVELAARMLARVGIDGIVGWVPIDAWEADGRVTASIPRRTMADLARSVAGGERLAVVDVRLEREWFAGHLPGAIHALPHGVSAAVGTVPDGTPVALYCSSGYRSALAASLLARDGRLRPWHVVEGVDAWLRLGHPLTQPA